MATTCRTQIATNTSHALTNPLQQTTVRQMSFGMTRVKAVKRLWMLGYVQMRVRMFHVKTERRVTMLRIRIHVHVQRDLVEPLAVSKNRSYIKI